jgi:hypothetical protein
MKNYQLRPPLSSGKEEAIHACRILTQLRKCSPIPAYKRTKRPRRNRGDNESIQSRVILNSRRVTRSEGRNANAVSPSPKSGPKGHCWAPDYLLSNKNSKLASCNMTVYFLVCPLTVQELINRNTWEMLTPQDRADCISCLSHEELRARLGAIDGTNSESICDLLPDFFDANAILQDDMRSFQVAPLCPKLIGSGRSGRR